MSKMFELLTEKEAAVLLRMSSRKLAEVRKAGEISFLKTFCIRYREQHLLDYLERCEVKAGERSTARFGYRAAGIHSDRLSGIGRHRLTVPAMGVCAMKKLDTIGRFSICDDRGKLYLRWWDRAARCTRSERLEAKTLTAARSEAKTIIRTIAEPLELTAPERRITKDPTFGEVWISYERQKEATLSKERFGLIKNRLDIYYRPNIWNEPMSNMSSALHRFVLFLQRTEYSRLKGKARAAATAEDRRKLYPNTISDIVRPVVEVCSLARKMGLTEIAPPDMPEIAGLTAPADRPKKGRYLSFDEIAALMDAAEREHMRDLLILALGTGARVGSLCDIEGAYVHSDLGVINLMKRESSRRTSANPSFRPAGRWGRCLNV